jgi:sirohydrochlorin cobaltochelatase
VSDDHFADAALVLVGHGSTEFAEASEPVYRHADALRRRGLFAQLAEGFWKQEPFLPGVLRGVFAPRVFVVPIFISEGYFSEEVLPREMGLRDAGQPTWSRVRRRPDQTLWYCRAVGTHEGMTNVLLAHAAEVVRRHPFPHAPPAAVTALVLAGHGTRENAQSRVAVESHVEAIRRLAVYAEVHGVYLEEEPAIERCYQLVRARHLVVVPFFISDGLHTLRDIPLRLGETRANVDTRLRDGRLPWRNPTQKHGRLVWYARSVGYAVAMPDLILERVREAASVVS